MLNRRDFLKLAALSTSALAFRPFQAFSLPVFPQADRLGRIAVGKMDVFAAPDGVASPTAHGQEITSTVTLSNNEKPKTPISPSL